MFHGGSPSGPGVGGVIGSPGYHPGHPTRPGGPRHRGFWHPADTVKERTALEAAYQSGTRPWMLWDAPDRDPLQAAIAELQGRLER